MPPTLTVFCKINIWKDLKDCLAQTLDKIQQMAHTVPATWSLLKICEHSLTWKKKPTQGRVTPRRWTWSSHKHVNMLCTPQYTDLWDRVERTCTQIHKGTPKKGRVYPVYPNCSFMCNSLLEQWNKSKCINPASDLTALRNSHHHTETKQQACTSHRAADPGENSQLHNIWEGFGSIHAETQMRFQEPLKGFQVSPGQALMTCLHPAFLSFRRIWPAYVPQPWFQSEGHLFRVIYTTLTVWALQPLCWQGLCWPQEWSVSRCGCWALNPGKYN